MGKRVLTVHRAERADTLHQPTRRSPSTAPTDAFTPDVIAVPSKGVERWIMQQLSLHLGADDARDGIAANIESPSPAGEVMSTLAGRTDADPWRGKRFVWSVLAVMDDCVAEPWCDMLAHHLGLDEPNEPNEPDECAPGIPVIGSAPV